MEKNKVIKITLIIILLIVIIFTIWLARKYMIINKISRVNNSLDKATNYSCIAESVSQSDSSYEWYYKDGKSKATWKVEGYKNIISWHDKATKENIVKSSDERDMTIKETEINELKNIVLPIQLPDKFKLGTIFNAKISSAEIDGEKCYEIILDDNVKYYFSKESGLIKKMLFSGGTSMTYKEWQFNGVTDAEVALPDIMSIA